jgi:3',5'-cyclic AMP phosphodiesterase CpdA
VSRRRAGGIVGLLVVLGLVGYLLVSPPSALTALLTGDRPSAIVGQRVPAIEEAPDVRIAVAGDTGTGTAAEEATAQRMAAESRQRPYDALLLLGDLIYDVGDATLVDRVVTEPFAPVLDGGAQLLPVLGNHDYGSGEQQQILTALGADAPWYAARVGPVRILVLDSNRVGDAQQTRWLRETLAAPQAAGTWTVAAMHHPAYSAGHHGSDLAVREAWGPLFADAGVPLVLAGHDHDYQRSTPQGGVTYVVSGAGASTRGVGHQDFTAVSSATLHYLDLLAYDDRLVGRAIDQQGNLLDSFTITR